MPSSTQDTRTAEAFTDLECELRVLLRRAGSAQSMMARRIHPDLQASAYPLLAHIAANPGVRGSDLADQFGVGRATISRQLSRLFELGLVDRQVDPDDSRGQIISLTDDGAARLEAATQARLASLKKALVTWSTDDVADLARLLHRYSVDVLTWQANR